MKTYYITLFFILISFCVLAATDVSGNQSGTWNLAGSPYNIVGDVTIPAGNSLTIEPGVQIYAMGNYRIRGYGALLANGSVADSIRFMSGQADPGALWKGIRLESETQSSSIEYCYIEKAEYGIYAIDSPVQIQHSRFNLNEKGIHLSGIGSTNPAQMEVSHNLIERSIQNGILISQNSNATVFSNEVRYNGTGPQYRAAIQLANQSASGQNNPVIHSNHIHHNHKQGISAWDTMGAGAINPDIYDNIIEYNLTGIYLLNASGHVHDNVIAHNFIPGDANSGAGVMVGGSTSQPYFERNQIYGNFTGFYLGDNAQPCLGNLNINHAWAQGGNHIYDNIDESNTPHSVYCFSYSNPSITIYAENNWWGTDDPAQIAVGIHDHNDDPSLPLVDFDPILNIVEGITINGMVTYAGTQSLSNPRLQIVSGGEILHEQGITLGQPFSIELEQEEPFQIVALADTGVPELTLYGSVGGLTDPIVLNPEPGDVMELGTIALSDTPPPRYETCGAPQAIGTRNCFPVYNSFFVYHWDYINWLYQEGDHLYLKRHTRYLDGQNTNFDFPDGTTWDKIANLQQGDTWTRTEVVNPAGETRMSTFSHIITMDDTPPSGSGRALGQLTLQTDNSNSGYISARVRNSGEFRLLHYENAYVTRQEQLSTNASQPYLQEGNYWHYFPEAPHYAPLYLRYDQPAHQQNPQSITLHWQGLMRDSAHEWSQYHVFDHEQLMGIVPLGAPTLTITGLSPEEHVYKVAATDGVSFSEYSNSVTLPPTAADDPQALPLSLSLWPNPVSLDNPDGLTLRLDSGKALKGQVSIYNLRGQKVAGTGIAAPAGFEWRWNLRSADGKRCASGIYFVKLELQGEKTITRKLALIR
ncbi:MAG: right-handed parallel beta-helix repeat-containing protein [Candidatus Cloacimonadota bacterium]|jgi:hypothetical protein|nr:right-handed parallel beta-helix repeat-containing protein [Candidatus Cloacimonadota bacterium]